MIKGDRVMIRPFQNVQDAVMYAELYNDLEERSIHDHLEKMDEVKWIERFLQGLYNDFEKVDYMIFNENDEFIGTIGFVKKSSFEINVGYRILLNKFRRKGYMSEALKLFIGFVFENFEWVDRISLNTAEDNAGSQIVAVNCGFSFEGILRKAYEYRNKRVDFYQYSMLREEWVK